MEDAVLAVSCAGSSSKRPTVGEVKQYLQYLHKSNFSLPKLLLQQCWWGRAAQAKMSSLHVLQVSLMVRARHIRDVITSPRLPILEKCFYYIL